MRKITIILTILAVIVFSCEESDSDKLSVISEITDSSSLEADNNFLDSLYQEISEMAGEFDCVDATEWNFTAIGTKACGGTAGYIAYSIQIDTVVFLEKVNLFTEQQDIFNKKWGIISDCTIPPRPKEIVCVDGQPEFIY